MILLGGGQILATGSINLGLIPSVRWIVCGENLGQHLENTVATPCQLSTSYTPAPLGGNYSQETDPDLAVGPGARDHMSFADLEGEDIDPQPSAILFDQVDLLAISWRSSGIGSSIEQPSPFASM